ncbi:outer membrane beta-barrel protein [Larkinella rosea]|uniref:PorT family protein n=1 Tax=Larkinella rosea TaxID=2025312 RepID=A0A3P1BSC0_9BACT|nr:outer membrane beta-barrel protein [Larkinella rosea]RRB04005.1 PorT family protein [Larkinella rosea]
MKTQLTLLATCLLGVQLANGQNTTSTTSTTSTSTYSAPVTDTTKTTGTTYTTSPDTPSTDNAVNANRTTETTVTTPAATNGYTTTTTTTTTTDDQMSRENRDKAEKPGGKSGKFGIYAGVNISKFVNEPIPDDAFRAGWQAGLYGRTGGTIFGQIGLEYRNSTNNLIRTGPGSTSGTIADQIRGKIDMHFLAIPAYVGARIGNTLGLRVQAGAELASLVAVGPNNFQLGKDDLNRTILNGLLGAGINLGPLTLDVVYNHGLQHVFDDADTKRRIWAFNLGFRF